MKKNIHLSNGRKTARQKPRLFRIVNGTGGHFLYLKMIILCSLAGGLHTAHRKPMKNMK